MGKSYTNVKYEEAKPSAVKRWLLRSPYFLAVVMSILAMAMVAAWLNREEGASTQVVTYGNLEELVNERFFREAYLKANGGLGVLSEIQSVRLFGRVENGDGSSYRFYSVRKRPDQLLMTLEFQGHSLTFGVDGQQVWRRTRAQGGESEIVILEGEEAAAMLAMGDFFGPFMRLLFLQEGSLESLESSTWDGEPCLKVRFTDSKTGVQMEAYVDAQSMNPMVRFDHYSDGRVAKTVFSDYRNLRGMQEPFRVESYLDEVLQSRVVIESGDANLGVVPWVFHEPNV